MTGIFVIIRNANNPQHEYVRVLFYYSHYVFYFIQPFKICVICYFVYWFLLHCSLNNEKTGNSILTLFGFIRFICHFSLF